MNVVVTSREEILKNSLKLIQRQGWSSVSIRAVAAACGVSVGSIYNYFDSKAELVSATVESVWCEIFHRPEDAAVFQDTEACVAWMYERMAYGCKQYPGFFTLHSLGFMREDKPDGKRLMQQTWQHILNGLCVRAQAGRKHTGGRLYGAVYSGKVCRCSVFAHAVRAAASGLRPERRAGDCPQDAVLISHFDVGN